VNPADREDLVAQWLEARERGDGPSAEAFAAAHPQAGDELLAALRVAAATEAMIPGPVAAIGAYRVLSVLGRGGAGEVLRVEPRGEPGRELALKRMLLPGDARARERFQREAQALRRVAHPGIVAVVDVGETEAGPFLVMELVRGRSLAELQGGLEPAVAMRIAAGLADAVTAVHAVGLLHRDLKPANVILAADGRPVLVDFGLVGGDTGVTLTGTGDVIGTPAFMAPEQARGEPCDVRTDVYALGAILFALLTGVPPHPGDDPVRVLAAVRSLPARSPRALVPALPRRCADVVRRAMAFRPGRRFATAEAFARALRNVLDDVHPARATFGMFDRAEVFVRRNRPGLVAVGCVALATLLGAQVLGARRDRQRMAAVALEVRAVTAHLETDREAERAAIGALLASAPDSAIGLYLQARLDGKAVPPGDVNSAMALAEDALGRGRNAGSALEPARAAMAAAPDSVLALALCGKAALAAERWELAEQHLATVVRLLPASVAMLRSLASAQRHRERFDDAETTLQRALLLAGEDPEVWHDLARLRSQRLDHEGAHQAILRAIAGCPAGPSETMLRTLGVILERLHRPDDAIAILEPIARRFPTAPNWVIYGRALDRAHRFAEAAAAYEAALAQNPDDIPALGCLIYLRTGSDPQCATCREAFRTQPELLQPQTAERLAIRALAAERGKFTMAPTLAEYLARAGRADAYDAELGALLQQQFDDAAMGRLLRARRALGR
jgi:tetratricopeptide (TPR) repeat protein/predicted Ser/Thr protein kinase